MTQHILGGRGRRRVSGLLLIGLVSTTPAMQAFQQSAPGITATWDDVIKDVVPTKTDSAALTQIQTPVLKSPGGDFLNHFFLDWRADYRRSDVNFTGLPTPTGVINAPFTGVFTPNGFPWEQAFQPSANRVYSYLDFGTRGWLSDRLNTHFGVRYRQDLTQVNRESPNANILGTYPGNRLVELVEASVEINSRATDGGWAGTTLELGRLNIYGAELATLDGASFHLNRRRYSLNLFGGRRYTYFSDPEQRGIGGGAINFHPDRKTTVGYEALFYVRGTHRVNFRRALSNSWMMTSYFRAYSGSPVDLNVQLMYGARSGKSSARLSFFQKLSDKDYSYDIYVSARDQDPRNRLLRLYLGQLQPFSLFAADARHTVAPRLSLSGAITVQRLNDNNADQSAFQTSFEDYRAGAQVVPVRRIVADFEYHQRDSDRLAPIPRTTFDDTRTSGETSVRDMSAQIRRVFGEGRLTLSGGVYYRRISIQNRFTAIDGAHQSGWLAGGSWKVDEHNRIFLDYSLDNDFFVFRPSISNARVLRAGWAWKY